MAVFYNGRYYATATHAANARARDTYTPQQMQIAATIARQQLPSHLQGRGSTMRVQQALASTAKALFGGQQQQAAPAPAPAPAAPSTPSVSQAAAAAAADVTTQYTKQIEDLQSQLAAAEEARKAATLDWETRSKQMEESLAAQQAASQQAVEALKIQSQQELAKLTEASNLQISGLQGQMESQQAEYQAGLKAAEEGYQTGLANLTANQRAFQINQARAGQGAELQIQPATPATAAEPAGTSMFKRRPRVVPMKISSQANLNVPSANVLNI